MSGPPPKCGILHTFFFDGFPYLGHGHQHQHQAQRQHDGETELRVTLQTIAAIAGMVIWDSINCGDISLVSFCHIGVTRTVLYLHSRLIIKYTPQQRVFGAFFLAISKIVGLDWLYISYIQTNEKMYNVLLCYISN